jgi:hypothetical protein
MRFRLRTLLIVAALGPPAIAAAWFLTKNPNVFIVGSRQLQPLNATP